MVSSQFWWEAAAVLLQSHQRGDLSPGWRRERQLRSDPWHEPGRAQPKRAEQTVGLANQDKNIRQLHGPSKSADRTGRKVGLFPAFYLQSVSLFVLICRFVRMKLLKLSLRPWKNSIGKTETSHSGWRLSWTRGWAAAGMSWSGRSLDSTSRTRWEDRQRDQGWWELWLQVGNMIYIFYGSLGLLLWKCGTQLLSEIQYKQENQEMDIKTKKSKIGGESKYQTILY